jgi:hypothetical protein
VYRLRPLQAFFAHAVIRARSYLLRVAVGLTVLFSGCGPATSRPGNALPEDLPPEPVEPIYVVNTGERGPGSPLALDRPLIVHGPGELVPEIVARVDAIEAGVVLARDGGYALSLTLGPCHFEEPETLDIPVTEDCRHFNHRWQPEREQRLLIVPEGDYLVHLTNTLDTVAGLWIRDNDDVAITPLSAGGAAPGATTTYRATLGPGTYRYSCTLTPTPDYLLVVEARSTNGAPGE